MAWFRDKMSRLSFSHILYLLVIPILLFQALSLAGCVANSPALPDLHLVSFSKNDTSSFPEFRVGYFGACTSTGNSTPPFNCLPTVHLTPSAIIPTLFPDPKGANPTEITALVTAALFLQTNIFIPLLAGAGLLFVVSLILLIFLKREIAYPNHNKPNLERHLKTATLACLALSLALGFTSCLGITEAAGALQYSSMLMAGSSRLVVKPGLTLQVLQWIAFGFTLLFTACVPVLLKGGGGGGGGGGFGDGGFGGGGGDGGWEEKNEPLPPSSDGEW